jgi:hypothetical protein
MQDAGYSDAEIRQNGLSRLVSKNLSAYVFLVFHWLQRSDADRTLQIRVLENLCKITHRGTPKTLAIWQDVARVRNV